MEAGKLEGPGVMNKVSGVDLDNDIMEEPNKVQRILATRGGRYGDYRNNAEVTQQIMRCLEEGLRYGDLNDMHREALHMIAHKMSRIVNGDANWHDSWDDIAGYAKLVSDRIPGEKEGT